jgi:hypothetical protein
MPIRTAQFERDKATNARAVIDIREFDAPSRRTPRTWTELASEQDRRLLILDLMRQIDDLAEGHIDEISIYMS